jgi:hypothetical protein
MGLDASYDWSPVEFDEMFAVLVSTVPQPIPVPRGGEGRVVFKFKDQTAEQAIIQKLARFINGLRAARLLLDAGYLQESSVIQRTLDEFAEDIMFLGLAVTSGYQGDTLNRYLDSFYADDFANSDDPMDSIKSRQTRVSRKDIRKAIDECSAKHSEKSGLPVKPATDPLRVVGKIFSGFVHGGSPQIMDLYGGRPPHFHLQGMAGTPFMDVHAESFWSQFYRCGQSFAIAALAFGAPAIKQRADKVMARLEEDAGKDYGRPGS